jgi:hypothetical protein
MKKSNFLGIVSFSLVGCTSHVIPKKTTAHTAIGAIGNTSTKAGTPDLYPDHDITPGATNPAVTQTTIQDTICKSGWTASIRPPVPLTNKLKTDGIRECGFDDNNPKDYEEDHFLPLELGGNPRDPKNLWPEPYNTQINGQRMGAHEKDKFETVLKKQVCSGALTLQDAQDQIVANWYKVYVAYF